MHIIFVDHNFHSGIIAGIVTLADLLMSPGQAGELRDDFGGQELSFLSNIILVDSDLGFQFVDELDDVMTTTLLKLPLGTKI